MKIFPTQKVHRVLILEKEGLEKFQRNWEKLDGGILCLNHHKAENENAKRKTESNTEVTVRIV